MSRHHEYIDSDKCQRETICYSICCCMPCFACFVTGEQLCKSLYIGILWVLSCPCLGTPPGREISPVIHEVEINEIQDSNFIDYAEETKDAMGV